MDLIFAYTNFICNMVDTRQFGRDDISMHTGKSLSVALRPPKEKTI